MCGVQFDPDLHYLLYHSVLLRGTKLYVKYCIVTVLCKHVLEDTVCYVGYLNKSCILYLVSCIKNIL